MAKQLVSFEDAAQQSSTTHWTWRTWASRGLIKTVKMGRRRLIPASEVDRVCRDGVRDKKK
jgi:excisionase family DNA binding protein